MMQMLCDEPSAVCSNLNLELKLLVKRQIFAQTVKMATDLKPQVVVMDLHMPDATRVAPSDVKASFASSASQLLAISIWDDEDSQALAKAYGAVAFLDKVKLGTKSFLR